MALISNIRTVLPKSSCYSPVSRTVRGTAGNRGQSITECLENSSREVNPMFHKRPGELVSAMDGGHRVVLDSEVHGGKQQSRHRLLWTIGAALCTHLSSNCAWISLVPEIRAQAEAGRDSRRVWERNCQHFVRGTNQQASFLRYLLTCRF